MILIMSKLSRISGIDPGNGGFGYDKTLTKFLCGWSRIIMKTSDKIKILLVEDELLIQKNTIRMLESDGYVACGVTSGEEAVEYIKESPNSINLILMDIDLGSGIDGIEASEQILTLQDIPIIFLSSHTEREIVEKTERITSYGYLVKGANLIILTNAIKMALKLFSAKTELKKERNHLDVLYNRSPAGYHSFDSEGKLIEINDTLLDWLGYTREETIGKLNIYQLVNPEERELEAGDLITKMKMGPIYNLELFYFRKNGSILPILFTSEPEYDEKGYFIKSRSVAVDHTRSIISEYELIKTRHELEVHQIELEMQSRELKLRAEARPFTFEKYSELFEASPLAYISIDREGCILDLNQSCSDLMKKDKNSLIGHLFDSFLSLDSRLEYRIFLDKVYQGNEYLNCDLKLQIGKNTAHINLRNTHAANEDSFFLMMLDTSSLLTYQSKVIELKASKY